jgi:hypothetical protein
MISILQHVHLVDSTQVNSASRRHQTAAVVCLNFRRNACNRDAPLGPRAAGRRIGVLGLSFLDRTIPMPSISEQRCQRLENRLFPMLPVAMIPWFPPALITTVSISKPLSATTKFAAMGGRPSVKLMVKVPVQSEFTM